MLQCEKQTLATLPMSIKEAQQFRLGLEERQAVHDNGTFAVLRVDKPSVTVPHEPRFDALEPDPRYTRSRPSSAAMGTGREGSRTQPPTIVPVDKDGIEKGTWRAPRRFTSRTEFFHDARRVDQRPSAQVCAVSRGLRCRMARLRKGRGPYRRMAVLECARGSLRPLAAVPFARRSRDAN